MRSGMEPERNARDMEALVREAAGLGATYVQTPEMTGAMVREKEAREKLFVPEDRDIIVATARRLAEELGLFLHIGSTAILREDGKVANRALLFSPTGETLASYDKIHMFDVDLDHGESWRESAAYEPGTRAVTARINDATLGFAICYDLRFPQLFRAEALAGAQVLTVPAAFTRQTCARGRSRTALSSLPPHRAASMRTGARRSAIRSSSIRGGVCSPRPITTGRALSWPRSIPRNRLLRAARYRT
jgi:predicted amidohydrolase